MAQINGTAGNDTLAGTSGRDEIFPGQGDDTVNAGDGDDLVQDDTGADTINGEGGNDFLTGGGGNDIVRGGIGNDYVSGGTGNDQVFGGDGDDTVDFTTGSDFLYGEAGNDRIQINGSEGDIVRAEGGIGNDHFVFERGGNATTTIDGGDGNDLVEIFAEKGRHEITLGTGQDIIRQARTGFITDFTNTIRLTVTDFAAGDSGDQLQLADWLPGTSNWQSNTNPFATGYLRLLQDGNDTLVQVSPNADGSFVTYMTLRNVVATSLTAYNFAGLAPNGAPLTFNRIETTPASEFVDGTGGPDLFIGSAGQDNLRGGGGYDRLILDQRATTEGVRGVFQARSSQIEATFFGPGQGNETRTFEIEDFEFRGGSGEDNFTVLLNGTASPWRILLDGGAGNDSVSIDLSLSAAVVTNDPNASFQDGIILLNFESIDAQLGRGNDVLALATSAGSLFGGDGHDRLTGGTLDDYLVGEGGTDTLTGAAGNDTLISGGSRGDSLDRGLEADQLLGEGGNDLLVFGLNDSADGGSGIDAFSIDMRPTGSAVVVDFSGLAAGGVVSNGSGSLRNFESYRMILGTDFNDVINVGDLSQPAREINSTQRGVSGLDGNDLLIAGAASNALYGGNGDDRIVAGGGDDYASGDLGRDLLYGEDGNDLLQGDDGDDGLDGGRGNDELDGGAGADVMIGGLGNDLFKVENANDIVAELAGEGTDTVAAMTSYYLGANIENLTLAAFSSNHFGVGNDLANVLTGNFGQNLLIGGGGNDIARGGDARDALFGESGDDQLFGEFGVDYIVGGFGNDSIDGGIDADEIYGQDGDDVLNGGLGFHTDIIVGGDGNDVIRGDSGQGDFDFLYGNAGNDSFYVDTPADLVFEQASEGTDIVFANINGAGFYLYDHIENLTLLGNTPFGVGNALANVITGNAQGNFLLGGAGDDILNGLGGGDVLFGEGGTDTFVFGRGTGGDVIGDFARGSDRIDVRAFGFTSFAQLQSVFSQVGNDGAIALGNGDFVVLHAVTMNQLVAADFIL